MTIKVLAENTAISDNFRFEHGLSLYIETSTHKILFDTGQSDLFLDNAKKLEVDIASIDTVIISHGHYDHGGGLKSFLQHNRIATIFINKNAFGDFYSSPDKFIGLDKSLQESKRIVFNNDEYTIDDDLFLFTANNKKCPYQTQSNNLYEKLNEELHLDMFLHEQYLCISENDKKVLISGCSHKGILNIMNFTKDDTITILIGGFHFKNLELDQKGKTILDTTAEELKKYKTKYFTCHCTGVSQYKYLKNIMGNQIEYLSSGQSISI